MPPPPITGRGLGRRGGVCAGVGHVTAHWPVASQARRALCRRSHRPARSRRAGSTRWSPQHRTATRRRCDDDAPRCRLHGLQGFPRNASNRTPQTDSPGASPGASPGSFPQPSAAGASVLPSFVPAAPGVRTHPLEGCGRPSCEQLRNTLPAPLLFPTPLCCTRSAAGLCRAALSPTSVPRDRPPTPSTPSSFDAMPSLLPHLRTPHTHGTRSRCRQRERVLTLQCCETSIFLMTLRIDAPYRVPYFPVIPTFLVRFPMVREVCV